MFGRMYPIKGHRTMLGMMPRIVESCPDALLLLAGDGPERKACEDLASALGLGRNVLFLGQRTDVPELLAACDLLVMTSESEGFGLAAIEAMAMGKPVVGFAVGGLTEIVEDGRTGHLVPFGDTQAFVAAVKTILNDPKGLDAFAVSARCSADRFDLGIHVRQLLNCYREQAWAS